MPRGWNVYLGKEVYFESLSFPPFVCFNEDNTTMFLSMELKYFVIQNCSLNGAKYRYMLVYGGSSQLFI